MWELIIEGGIEIGKAIYEAWKKWGAGSEAVEAWWNGKLVELKTSSKASCLAETNNLLVDAERRSQASGGEAAVFSVDRVALKAKLADLLVEFRKAFNLPPQ